jgi:hypothetical protein
MSKLDLVAVSEQRAIATAPAHAINRRIERSHTEG